MEYIDDAGKPARQLKDASFDDARALFDEIISMIKRLFSSGLVHGDLSEFNILLQGTQPVFIDFSQSATTDSSRAKELLKRDVEIICRFFRKRGVDVDIEATFASIITT